MNESSLSLSPLQMFILSTYLSTYYLWTITVRADWPNIKQSLWIIAVENGFSPHEHWEALNFRKQQ